MQREPSISVQTDPDRSATWPRWVRLAMWGLPNKKMLRRFFRGTSFLAVASLIYGIVDDRLYPCMVLAATAYWYYRAGRWLDQNDSSW